MKQSTKLLSLVLALVMAFSCMAVIGNAALVKTEIAYDSLDDAALSPEQVADLALDLVDNDLLAGMEPIDLSIVGELRLDSVDHIAADIGSLTGGFVWTIGKGLLGDLGDMNFNNIKNKKRSDGDLQFIYSLLQFLADNASIVSKAAYGIGTSNGISLGLVSSFLDLGDVGDMLSDIPKMLVTMVYDMLVYGSYATGYENNSYPSSEDVASLPTNMDTMDEMIDNAIFNLLVNPQDYEYVDNDGDGTNETKEWDMGSVILPAVSGKLTAADITPRANSLFAILDKVAPYAINSIGINALNHNLKKALMEAVEIDLNEIDESDLPAAVAADFETTAVDGEESYVNYIAYDRMCENNGAFYYTTMKTVVEEDANGDPLLDEEGNEISHKERMYYKANMASGNEFASLINWSWEFVGSDVTPTGNQVQLNYENIKKDHDGDGTKSIVEGINDLLALVFDVALTDEVKADYEAFIGTSYVAGANSNLMTNVTNLTKYILVNFGELVFGSTSPYAHLTKAQVMDKDVLDLVVMIGPGFFEDVMPQLIFPKNADGTYAFHKGVQIYEFGALVIREFITDIAPNVNYDAYIFAEGTVTSENDRHFKELTVDQWFNLILNMGMDIAYTYLYNIANFGDTVTYKADGTGINGNGKPHVNITKRTNDYPAKSASNVYTDSRWTSMLDTVIMWCVTYVGGMNSSSVLAGFEPTTISAIDGPLDKLSYILNKLLPLGFVNGFSTGRVVSGVTLEFDAAAFLNNGLKPFFEDFDLSRILGLLGRNTKSAYNMLDDNNLVNAALNLVNNILTLVLRTTVLQGVNATNAGKTQSVDAVITQANLKTTVNNLLTGLNGAKQAILLNALPVVGKLIKGWGTEQSFNTPEVSLSRAIDLTNGATSETQTVTIRNASDGVWRHYSDEAGNEYTDNQYQIQVTDVKAYDQLGTETTSAIVKTTLGTQNKVDYGASTSFTYTASGVGTSGALVRFEIKYKVYDETGAAMANGKDFVIKSYAWLNYNPTDASQTLSNDSELLHTAIYTPHYVGLSTATDVIKTLSTSYFGRDYKFCTKSQTAKVTNKSGTVDGLTFASLSQEFANGSGGRYMDNIRNFDSYTENFVNEDGEKTSDTYKINGSINAATWEAANKASGSTSTFSIDLTDKDGTENKTFTIKYYDDIYQNKLASLTNSEMDKVRLAADYNLEGTVYANGLLTVQNTTDKEGEIVPRQSNSTATAWVDADENVYSASQVTVTRTEYVADTDNKITAVQENGKYVSAKFGTVEVDGEKVSVELVTAIDCATTVNDYVAHLIPGIRGAMQAFNANSVYNFQELYLNLYPVANDIEYCKKTNEQLAEEGLLGDDVGGAIDTLKATLNDVEAATTDDHNYTDYKMWRLNRLNDARDDAAYYINLKNDASNATIAEIDTSFPYTWIEEDDLRALVAANPELKNYVGGTDDENFVLALLEPLSEEELAAKQEWLDGRKLEYSTLALLDVEMASSYLVNMSNRLLPKYEEGTITTYLEDELSSIDAMIGDIYDDAVAAQYTERSWVRLIDAYEAAEAMLFEDEGARVLSQKNVFDLKYELQCARNELVLVENEADYSELETLIEQAEYALANQDLYDNTAKELGQVLAELGLQNDVINADGDVVDLFPGSAYYVNAEPYSVDDQEALDNKASELKEALARLKFKGLSITNTEGKANTSTAILVEADEEKGIEEVTATIANIAKEMSADDVKALFKVAASNAGTVDVTVSNDLHYTVSTDLEGFAGTNAVVTFYTTNAGVNIPVATVRLVVNGDINGDGAVDVLDGAYAQLVSTEKAELEGCYLLAGDLSGNDRVVGAADYAALVNLIVA